MNMGCGPSIYKEQKMTIKINTKIKIYLYTTWQNQIHYLPKIWGYCCHRHKFLQSSLKGRSRMWNGNTWKNNNNYLHFMKVNWNISPPFNPYSFYISYINFLSTKSSSRKKKHHTQEIIKKWDDSSQSPLVSKLLCFLINLCLQLVLQSFLK